MQDALGMQTLIKQQSAILNQGEEARPASENLYLDNIDNHSRPYAVAEITSNSPASCPAEFLVLLWREPPLSTPFRLWRCAGSGGGGAEAGLGNGGYFQVERKGEIGLGLLLDDEGRGWRKNKSGE
jgi:hypothetical protein